MALIKDVFNETYPQLVNQLKELGINSTIQLKERFESNSKYLTEELGYDFEDNEKIRSIAEVPPELEVGNGRMIGFILSALIVIGGLLYFLYWLFKGIFNS